MRLNACRRSSAGRFDVVEGVEAKPSLDELSDSAIGRPTPLDAWVSIGDGLGDPRVSWPIFVWSI
jgi:hypothetical protein